MKIIISAAILVLTFSAHAFQATGLSTVGSFFSSGGNICKEAVQVIDDVNAFNTSGELSVYLSSKILEVKSANPELSDAEAVDLLVDSAEKIISENSK